MADSLPEQAGQLRRFLLESQPLRGFWTRLDGPWRELRTFHRYPPRLERLLGEAVTASVLLAATLKFEGTLTLQLAGDGLAELLVAQCTHDFRIRAVARTRKPIPDEATFRELVGDGRLSVAVEAEERAARYQGIVAITGDSLSACLENYFETSEQLPTRIALAADADSAAGVLLQKMPASSGQGEAQAAVSQQVWEQLETGVRAVDAAALRLSSAEELIQRLCGEHDCRVFAPTAVRFACRCDPERVAALLRSLGVEEMRSILAQEGAVSVQCEFCGRPYRYDAVDIERLFAEVSVPEPPRSLN